MAASRFSQRAGLLRVSLREMLLLVALVAVATVTLKYASEVWLIAIVGAAFTAVFAALIVAVVDRGPSQAFAIGFSLVSLGYGALLLGSLQRDAEYSFSSGGLPSSLLLRRLYPMARRAHWLDPDTREEIPVADAMAQRRAIGVPTKQFGGGPVLVNLPQEQTFMPIGHGWFAIALAYLGGKFARYVYIRRVS